MKFLRRLFLTLAGALLALILVESWLAWKRPRARDQNRFIYSYAFVTSSETQLTRDGDLKLQLHPHLLYTNRPDQKFDRFSINSRGFRGDPPREKRSGKRMVLVGGSAAFGTGLPKDESTLAAQLGKELGVESINAAVIGYRSTQELLSVALQIQDLQPQLVVAFNGANDFFQIFDDTRDRHLGTQGFELIEFSVDFTYGLANAWWPEKVRAISKMLFPETNALLQRAFTKYRVSSTKRNPASDTPSAQRMARIEQTYVSNMRKLHRLGKGGGFKVVVVIQPIHDRHNANINRLYKEFSHRVAQRLRSLGILHLNLADAVGMGVLTENDFIDSLHPNREGTRKLADYLRSSVSAALGSGPPEN